MKTIYIPVAVTIDDDQQVRGAHVDWEGAPWMDTDNIWDEDDEVWVKDEDIETIALDWLGDILSEYDYDYEFELEVENDA